MVRRRLAAAVVRSDTTPVLLTDGAAGHPRRHRRVRQALVQRIPEDQRRRRHDRGRRARRRRPEGAGLRTRRTSASPPERCYTDAAARVRRGAGRLLHGRRARPSITSAIIDLALAHGLDILCEKPIADTMAASLRIARKVARRRTQDGGDDEPSLRPGQDDAAPDRALRRARQDQRDRHAASRATCASTWRGARCSATGCATRC